MANKNDRLFKLRSIIDNVNEKFEHIYIPEECISLNELLMKYKGRL